MPTLDTSYGMDRSPHFACHCAFFPYPEVCRAFFIYSINSSTHLTTQDLCDLAFQQGYQTLPDGYCFTRRAIRCNVLYSQIGRCKILAVLPPRANSSQQLKVSYQHAPTSNCNPSLTEPVTKRIPSAFWFHVRLHLHRDEHLGAGFSRTYRWIAFDRDTAPPN